MIIGLVDESEGRQRKIQDGDMIAVEMFETTIFKTKNKNKIS